KRQRLQQNRVCDAVNGRRRTNADAKGQHGHSGESKISSKVSDGVARVSAKIFDPRDTSTFVKSLLSLHDVAERSPRESPGLLEVEPLFVDKAPGFLFHVRMNLFGKIRIRSPSPRPHGQAS